MEEVIERVGLPVKCRLCDARGRVKPRTDYGGWQKRKTILGITWYCPAHSGAVERLKNVPLSSIPKEVEQTDGNELKQLMDLI